MDAPEVFLLQTISQPAAPDLLMPSHICQWDATEYGPQRDEEFMSCAGCPKAMGQAGTG